VSSLTKAFGPISSLKKGDTGVEVSRKHGKGTQETGSDIFEVDRHETGVSAEFWRGIDERLNFPYLERKNSAGFLCASVPLCQKK